MQGEAPKQGAGYDARLFGMVLGFAGALLDFYSGYLLLTSSSMDTSDMGMIAQSNASGLVWGIGIAALGVVLAVTALATRSLMRTRMRDLGGLMMVYGVAMLFIGTSMYAGITSMTQGALFPSLGMFVVGALMIVNGVMMWRPRM